MAKQRADLTFKYNLKQGRHGWLRLTPAYSIKIVRQILEKHRGITYVLDPFSGTGTTGLVCAENNTRCDLIDINPFLVWFARVKTSNYEIEHLQEVQRGLDDICEYVVHYDGTTGLWFPPIHNITRWWSMSRLAILGKIYQALDRQSTLSPPATDLLKVAFCSLIINWSNAAFNHQSMSFKETLTGQLTFLDEEQQILDQFSETVQRLIAVARIPLRGRVKVIQADSRNIPFPVESTYDCVITSPPYPNRMSYIRELRPYMYWLGYLKNGREAGELDWQAIGGTWGIATSRLQTWQPSGGRLPYSGFDKIIAEISEQSPSLASYVHKYFEDMLMHIKSLYLVLSSGAKVFYVVGNSRFYDTLVPTERICANFLEACGFADTNVQLIRKRNSKKELFEFIVSAKKLD